MNRLRGLRDISTFMNLRRSRALAQRNVYEIFNELAQMAREKARLIRERENWQERLDRIDERLKEIDKLEVSLRQCIAEKEKAASDVEDAKDVQDTKQTAKSEGREVTVKY